MNQIMINNKEQRIERIGNSFMTSFLKVSALRYALVLVMMIVSIGIWGQPAGVWYIANDKALEGATFSYDSSSPEDRYYMVPAKDPVLADGKDAYYSENYNTTDGDPAKPYLTTFKTNQDANSVWVIKSAGSNLYFLIHVLTGKYAVYNTTPDCTSKPHRKVIHLETLSNPDNVAKAKFYIENTNTTFRPQSLGSGNRYFNPSNGNMDLYHANGGDCNNAGLVGVYSDPTGGSKWHLERALLTKPTISNPDANNKVTIEDANSLPSGYEIRYTTDGSTIPTASTGTVYSGSIPITASVTIKAVVVRYGMVLTEVASETREPAPCATPVISFNSTTSKVSITCATEGSTIFYSVNGGAPTTAYSGPFSIDGPTTVKAIATHAAFDSSSEAELAITQVVTPTIQNNGSNAISITTTTPGATIYYTTDGSTPTTSSTEYTDPLTENVSNVTIKAIAVKKNMITSAVGSGTVKLQCASPVITRDGMTFTLSCSFPTDANLYYKLGDGSEQAYSGTPVSFTSDQMPMTVTAVARHSDYTQSETASFELLNGTGTSDDPYLIYGATDFANFVTNVNNGTTSSAYYKLETDVSGSGVGAITTAFTGTFDGGLHTISNLGHALFNTVNGGVVKNVILDNVGISSGSNVGAICNEATGDTRIYNCGVLATGSTVEKDEDGYDYIKLCSSTISGSGYVGSIVGLLDGSSRVINCFSYADVSGGSHVGGIVGYNNVATTSAANNLKTMVMNCMFYGEVSGSSIAPIYNGEIITNNGNNGVSNFNYFRLESNYIKNTDITKVYNCALGAETRFLQRFEFFRYLLNSNRELAAWWASTSTTTVTKDEMMKWVMEPSQIGSTTPYPSLKHYKDENGNAIKYSSVVNIDADNATTQAERNKGGKLGTLTVKIQMGTGGAIFGPPTGATITNNSLPLNITDKDPDHFNFNYYKVQLPYYNDVGTKNYNGNRVVTGWKIVDIQGGTPGTFSNSTADAPSYNFADRHCTNKDLYGVSGRVFNQGAYWDVPEGVNTITIEPYWAKCVYLADAYADVVYNTAMTSATNVPNVGGGQKYTNRNDYPIAGESQKVFTSKGDAIATSNYGLFQGANVSGNHTVYDYAVVLVGNYHFNGDLDADKSKPYTVTSIDLDGDNEPDYSYILRFDKRKAVHPVRVDFINIPGLGMTQKSTGGTGSYNFGIMQPLNWFESTNTSLFRVTQLEYDRSDRTAAPYIVQGGVMEQWVSGQSNGVANNITYFHVGGNVWFKEFHRGTHQDKTLQSKHPPVSVTGGDYDEFYLTGLYTANVTSYEDNAECYINGGRFGIVAGAAMEGLGKANGADNTGNITWQVQNADINEFYAGGINADKPVQGNLSTVVEGGYIKLFCGGPKFGDMSTGKTVTTTATGCTFDTFFGAGYGGNSYSREAPRNHNNIVNFPHNDKEGAGNDASWNAWLARFYKQEYSSTYGGVSTQFNYQFLPMSSNVDNVARIFVEYVKFSLATTRSVSSTLTNCTINENFYGGGSLGKVAGTITSTLDGCTVKGNVFGAGFSANLPKVKVDYIGFKTEPHYYEELGTYRTGEKYDDNADEDHKPKEYTWEYSATVNSIDKTNKILYTSVDIRPESHNLGSVDGDVNLTLKGATKVGTLEGGVAKAGTGNVFGGGQSSYVTGAHTVTVTLEGNAEVYGNVFGGGDQGNVEGSTKVNIKE